MGPSAVVSGHGLGHLAGDVARQRVRNVAETDHAHHLHRLVEHWQPSDLLSLHDADGVLDVLVVAAIDYAGCHHVLGLDLGYVLAVGHTADGDVTVCDHADELAVGGNRNGADIELAHSLGDGVDRGVGRHAFNALMHHIFHFHRELLWTSRLNAVSG